MSRAVETARTMVRPGKGILAMDESNATCNKRFAALGIEPTEEQRRRYRQLLVTTPGLAEFVAGAILYDETLRQSTDEGVPFPRALEEAGIIPGIKVDTGAKDLAGHPGEKVTEGLDGLRDRLVEYSAMGARFAKWRAVLTIGPGRPSRGCIEANAHALARYAALCQEAGITPIVEPEVVMEGDHGIEVCEEVTGRVLDRVFAELRAQRVDLAGIVLKTNMVVPGADSEEKPSAEEVARATVGCLTRVVPSTVPGVAFLSGGQSNVDATARLDAMNRIYPETPWRLTFSYGRALQRPALETWRGQTSKVEDAQRNLLHRARLNAAASVGAYDPSMDTAA